MILITLVIVSFITITIHDISISVVLLVFCWYVLPFLPSALHKETTETFIDAHDHYEMLEQLGRGSVATVRTLKGDGGIYCYTHTPQLT